MEKSLLWEIEIEIQQKSGRIRFSSESRAGGTLTHMV